MNDPKGFFVVVEMIAANYMLFFNISSDPFFTPHLSWGLPLKWLLWVIWLSIKPCKESYLLSDRHISKMLKSTHSKCSPILMLNQRHFVYFYKISGYIYIYICTHTHIYAYICEICIYMNHVGTHGPPPTFQRPPEVNHPISPWVASHPMYGP